MVDNDRHINVPWCRCDNCINTPDPEDEQWFIDQSAILTEVLKTTSLTNYQIKQYDRRKHDLTGAYLCFQFRNYTLLVDIENARTLTEFLERKTIIVTLYYKAKILKIQAKMMAAGYLEYFDRIDPDFLLYDKRAWSEALDDDINSDDPIRKNNAKMIYEQQLLIVLAIERVLDTIAEVEQLVNSIIMYENDVIHLLWAWSAGKLNVLPRDITKLIANKLSYEYEWTTKFRMQSSDDDFE